MNCNIFVFRLLLPVLLLTTTLSAQENDINNLTEANKGTKGLGIQLRSGVKLAESSDYAYATQTGFYGGLTIIIPLGKSADLQPEFNYSNSANPGNSANNYHPSGNIVTKEFALMFGFKYFLKNFIVKFNPGLGIVRKSGNLYTRTSEKLLSFTLGIGIYRNISENLTAGFELRKQIAASPNAAGGSLFSPFISTLSISYYIPKVYN